MPNKMLIDASHPEETRVVVVRGNRIEEFDFESQDKKQLKGNIYLARVTRVEPSLQAAFVEYGGNRHGFLAFSEIHPDYYQIPVADRQALLRAEADEHAEEDDERRRGARARPRPQAPPRRQEPRPRRDLGRRTPTPTTTPAPRRRGCRSDDGAGEDWTPEEEFESADVAVASSRRGRVSRAAASEAADGDETAATEDGAQADDDGTPPKSIAAAVESDVVSEERVDRRRQRPCRGSPFLAPRRGERGRIGRRRGRARGSAQPPQAGAPPLQDPGSHQAPPDPAGAGRQGRARQQGRGAHHLSVARRPLFRADAQHGARRRHFAQDHQRRRTASA